MPEIFYLDNGYTAREGETVLDCLLRYGKDISFSCRNGVCQTCLLKSLNPSMLGESIGRLSTELIGKGYFLPCKTKAVEGLEIVGVDPQDLTLTATVASKKALHADIVSLLLEPHKNIQFSPSQKISISAPDGATGTYPVLSWSEDEPCLEIHIKVQDRNPASQWLFSGVQEGVELTLSHPFGDSLYSPAAGAHCVILAFNDGISSAYAVARMMANLPDSPAKLHLLHLVKGREDCYLEERLHSLAKKYDTVTYDLLKIDDDMVPPVDAILAAIGDSTCHAPNVEIVYTEIESPVSLIEGLKKLGVPTEKIHSIPSLVFSKNLPRNEVCTDAGKSEAETILNWKEADYPPPTPDLWRRLQQHNRLKRIVDDFYDLVFEDPLLSPYFHNTTKQRSKEKVYSFYKRVFGGEECYFGDRPKNAHHWMVISNEIFDHRLKLLTSCMKKHGLSNKEIDLWRSYEEHYRNDIVKAEPRGRRIGDIILPAGGFAYETLSEGSMCDSCYEAIEKDTTVLYNKRTGQIYCPNCHPNQVTDMTCDNTLQKDAV